MRWTYLITRLVIVALVWGFFAFGMDPILRYGAVVTMQSATGARVDVAEVQTKFFPPTLTVRNVALASARRHGKNLMQFDELHLSLEPSSLSRRRFVVEDGRLTGVQFDTDRADDGQLEKTEEPIDEEPSWVSEKLTELGNEWLTNLTEQVKAELDPNSLETYRNGNEMYAKWDVRFDDMSARAVAMEPRVRQLKEKFDRAKRGNTLEQIEQYLTVSQEAEQLIREAQGFSEELKEIVPEVREDFKLLNEARERDQERIRNKLALLKPDGRRITEALLGKPMYRQLQQILTWVEVAREYQSELGDQVQPPRNVGRDFEFEIRNPAPDFLLKRLTMSGQMSVSGERVPFTAVLSDVTEDPGLLQRPCVLQLTAKGTRPLNLKVSYDATGEAPIAEMIASYSDTNPIPLLAGKPQETCLRGTLSDLSWRTRLRLVRNEITGVIDLDSRISNLLFEAPSDVRAEIVEAANESFLSLSQLNAKVVLSGTLRDPQIDLQSDVGEQVAIGVQRAFTHQLDRAKDRLQAEINTFAGEQITTLTGRFKGEYDLLLAKNKDVLAQIGEVQEIVATLRSGRMDAAGLVKQVTNSRLIPEKDQQKIRNIMGDVEQTLNGHTLPAGLQDKLQRLPSGIPGITPGAQSISPAFPQLQKESQRLTNSLEQLPVSIPKLPGSFRSLIPNTGSSPQKTSPKRNTE